MWADEPPTQLQSEILKSIWPLRNPDGDVEIGIVKIAKLVGRNPKLQRPIRCALHGLVIRGLVEIEVRAGRQARIITFTEKGAKHV